VFDLKGKWTNQNGSTLIIDDVINGRIQGRFESRKGRAERGIEYPAVGLHNGELISFVVSFDKADDNLHSITSFSGRLLTDSDGRQRIHTMWTLARQFEDADRKKPTQFWNSFITNTDVFTQTAIDV